MSGASSIECKNGEEYNAKSNTCQQRLQCPSDVSTGMYPNCTCVNKNFDFNSHLNICFRVCPANSTGYWPQCICDVDGNSFNKKQFKCIPCPSDSAGIPPKCSCGGQLNIYNERDNKCGKDDEPNSYVKCPSDSDGEHPNCTCYNDGVYNKSINRCNNECPLGSIGEYPNCNCTNGSLGDFYFIEFNLCEDIWCKDSTGVYPNCKCKKTNQVFSAYLNLCYTPCTENKIFGKFPQCICKPNYYYDVKERLCKSNVGRKCPDNSIGAGPDCLCIIEGEQFFDFPTTVWKCSKLPPKTSSPSICPDGGMYPQCDGFIRPMYV